MRYWYLVFKGKNDAFGSFCSYGEGELEIASANRAAGIHANGFAVITNWLEISERQYLEYTNHVERVHFIDESSNSDDEEKVQ